MSELIAELSSASGPSGRMPAPLDRIDDAILHALEADSRLTADDLALRIGESPKECQARIAALEKAGHIAGYTLVREYPDPGLRPGSAVIRVVQDPARTGADLLRTLDFIPEIVSAVILDHDRSLLLRLQVSEPRRLEAITRSLRTLSSVVSVGMSTTTMVLSNPRPAPKPPIG